MKTLTINDDTFQAERIIVDKQRRQIVGQDADGNEVFALRGVKFENITYEITDEQGNPVEPDLSSDEELARAIGGASSLAELKDALLGKIRPGRAARRPV